MPPLKRLPPTAPLIRGAVGMAVFVGILELAVALGIVDVGSVPRPSAIFAKMGMLLTDPSFLGQVWVTVKGVAVGLGAAIVCGTTLGALIATSTIARKLLLPVIEMVRPMPGIAYAPLLIAVFQRGLMSRSVTVAIACTWPILFNTRTGFASVDPVAKQTARSFGEDRFGVIRRINFPSASPFVFTGIRVAASIAIVVEIAVEIFIPDGTGIGGYLDLVRLGGGDLATIYGATMVAGVLSLALNFGLGAIDTRFFGWRVGLDA